MGIERRRDRRYPFHVAVILSGRRQEVVAQTEDVSFKGIFLHINAPLPERHLVRLQLTLPPDNDLLEVMGMVARNLPSSAGRPGAGIQFYGMAPASKDRWARFIRFVMASSGKEANGRAATTANLPGSPEPLRRRYPRYGANLQVHLRTQGDLQVLYTRNVSRGGLFVNTTLDLPAGTPLRVSVVHPRTGEQFPLDAVVRWRAAGSDAGLGLEFVQLSEERREDFFEFIRSEIPVEQIVYDAREHRHLTPAPPTRPEVGVAAPGVPDDGQR